MVKNWDSDCSPEVFGRSRSWGICLVTLATTCPGDWWCSPNLTTHFRHYFKPLVVMSVNILSDFLEGWCQCFHLRNCLDYVFSLLLNEVGGGDGQQKGMGIRQRLWWPLVRTFCCNALENRRQWRSANTSPDREHRYAQSTLSCRDLWALPLSTLAVCCV